MPTQFKRGKYYTTGTKFPKQEEYQVSLADIVAGINADPDLDAVEKAKAIRLVAGLKGAEQTAILNQMYKKAYGSDVNTTTPLADFIRTITERRFKRKKR